LFLFDFLLFFFPSLPCDALLLFFCIALTMPAAAVHAWLCYVFCFSLFSLSNCFFLYSLFFLSMSVLLCISRSVPVVCCRRCCCCTRWSLQ
jgi:hypothetical protein